MDLLSCSIEPPNRYQRDLAKGSTTLVSCLAEESTTSAIRPEIRLFSCSRRASNSHIISSNIEEELIENSEAQFQAHKPRDLSIWHSDFRLWQWPVQQ